MRSQTRSNMKLTCMSPYVHTYIHACWLAHEWAYIFSGVHLRHMYKNHVDAPRRNKHARHAHTYIHACMYTESTWSTTAALRAVGIRKAGISGDTTRQSTVLMTCMYACMYTCKHVRMCVWVRIVSQILCYVQECIMCKCKRPMQEEVLLAWHVCIRHVSMYILVICYHTQSCIYLHALVHTYVCITGLATGQRRASSETQIPRKMAVGRGGLDRLPWGTTYLCVCVCVCMNIYIYVYTYTCVNLDDWLHMYMHTHIHVCLQEEELGQEIPHRRVDDWLHMYIWFHIYTHTYIHTGRRAGARDSKSKSWWLVSSYEWQATRASFHTSATYVYI